MTRIVTIGIAAALALCAGAHSARADGADVWNGYLDYAYVYSSAEAEPLAARLAQYGREAGMTLDQYIARQALPEDDTEVDDATVRRVAIAHLLRYLATAEPEEIETSARIVRRLEDRLRPHENRYWYDYVLAQQALELGHRFEFVERVLDLWLGVVVPLESPYESLQNLALNDSAGSGFVSALPHLYENVTRLVLIRSQEMGVDRSLDPLSALVWLLDDGRVGAHPEVIPASASSREFLDRIVARLGGPESDAGSLTFTLALFEAARQHERARALLASDGFSAETLEALRATTGAYERALERSDTAQGQCAVYTRVLRQLGEVYAAMQRLDEDPDIDSPFSIEGAIEVYSTLARGEGDGEAELGYGVTGHQSYVDALHGLWEEIQEATLNAADYYLSQGLEHPHLADEDSRNAARLYSRYLAFFQQFATAEHTELVPDSAYFAAYEAARGYGDALLRFATDDPSPPEVERAIRRYRVAMRLFPFDRGLWPALTEALAREGREHEYLGLVQPIAESVTHSRVVDRWIEQSEPGADQIARLRSALSDTLVIMHLGFADAEGVEDLESGLDELQRRYREVEARIATLERESREPDAGALERLAREERTRELEEAHTLAERLDHQIVARSRALPLYRAALEGNDLASELRARRDHPGHVLLRRMYYENRS